MLEQLKQHPFSAMYALMAIPRNKKALNIDHLLDDVCMSLGISRQEIAARTRKTRIKYARWIVWKIMRSHKIPLLECAAVFGYDHSTVIHAMTNIDRDLADVDYVRNAYISVKKHEHSS
jgi:chromosomal replication initiation ATPase DnaA